ncbi:Thioredoxin-like protein 1 [Physocladia obscura]|uniref:Thioredoxin-like protein 1 n=1 Tax=Physocladia obscura TaxID=109957 RepID=A0AAD5SXG3_9FUNG|nr:Thioredoxin-like protein 1 [Physocladia obscura]
MQGTLTEFIDKKQIECLNQSDKHTFTSIFGPEDASKQYLESDVDEQIILVVPFHQVVKLHSIKITGPKENAPSYIKTFINRPVTLSFDEAETIDAIESIDLTPLYSGSADDSTVTATVQLRFVKYQSVNSVTIFVGQNLGKQDTTVINKIVFYGSPVEVTKSLTELKKDGHEH